MTQYKPKSAAHRERIRQSKLGLKMGPMTDEQRAKISASLTGRTVSEETKAKMRSAKKGRTLSADHKAALKRAWDRRKKVDGHDHQPLPSSKTEIDHVSPQGDCTRGSN
jgi:hypothetical protein